MGRAHPDPQLHVAAGVLNVSSVSLIVLKAKAFSGELDEIN